ncbi:MAG: type VI secretion system baseplate subunit TssE [Deltaproteobacteria bacterium]|nr:type VI secretion system baseplate subunit TssE [Candidatus Tharpella sp.]
MVDLICSENLQPSLLDRLTDNQPDKRQESRDERTLNFRRLKQSVVRDLEWLLNSGSLSPAENLSDFPEIRHSVLNYGVSGLVGSHVSGVEPEMVVKMLRQAVIDFEPRILPATLSIRIIESEDSNPMNNLAFEIEGQLWAHPLPEHLHVRTTMDLELGTFEIKAS